MRSLISLTLAAFISLSVYANDALDKFFSDVPRDVTVKEVKCTVAGKTVESLRLDSFHNYKDANGNWYVQLAVDSSAVIAKLVPESGRYTLSESSEGKRLEMKFYHGPEWRLTYANSRLELTILEVLPQFPGEDLIRECVYR